MKRLFAMAVLMSATFCFSVTLGEAIGRSADNPSLQAARHRAQAYEERYEAAKADNYPALDLSYAGTYLKEDPVVYMQSSFPGLPPGTAMQVQSRNRYTGALRLTYPLFTGFAVSAGIDAAKLQMHRAALEAEDTRRNLYLGIVGAYTTAVAMKQLAASQRKELDAIQKSYAKAKGFYDLQMLSISELSRIEADLHATQARMIRTDSAYKTALSQLALMTNRPVGDVGSLPETARLSLDDLTQEALQKRPDLQAVRLAVQQRQAGVRVAESGYYPNVALYAQAVYQGDGPELDGDGYTNKDRSAAGFEVTYNLFSGFKTQHRSEAARQALLAAGATLQAYEKRVRTEVYEAFLAWQSAKDRRDAAAAQIKAQEAYEAYVQGRFSNQLADADELSRAIAASAMARAGLIEADAKLFSAYSRALLQTDSDRFLAALGLDTPSKE